MASGGSGGARRGGRAGPGGCGGSGGSGGSRGAGKPCKQGGPPAGGEPVDLSSGIHVLMATDLTLQGGRGSIYIQRVYSRP